MSHKLYHKCDDELSEKIMYRISMIEITMVKIMKLSLSSNEQSLLNPFSDNTWRIAIETYNIMTKQNVLKGY